MNPGSIMKIMNAKNKFAATHPKFVSFFKPLYVWRHNRGHNYRGDSYKAG